MYGEAYLCGPLAVSPAAPKGLSGQPVGGGDLKGSTRQTSSSLPCRGFWRYRGAKETNAAVAGQARSPNASISVGTFCRKVPRPATKLRAAKPIQTADRLFSPSPRERSECGGGPGVGGEIGHQPSTPQPPVGTFCRKVPRRAAKHRAAAHQQNTTRRHPPPPGPISGTARQAVPTRCAADRLFSPSPRERSECGGGPGGGRIGHQPSIPQPPVGTFCRKVPRRAKRPYAAQPVQHTTRRHPPPLGSISGTARQAVPTRCAADRLFSPSPRERSECGGGPGVGGASGTSLPSRNPQ